MSEGFLNFVGTMPLAAVDELSDDNGGGPLKEDAPKLPLPKPKVAPKEKAKTLPKPKVVKGLVAGASTEVKAKEPLKPKPKPKVLKRPSALRKPVGKCFYKNYDMYGYKKDGKQIMTVPWLSFIGIPHHKTCVPTLLQVLQKTRVSTQSLCELSSSEYLASAMTPLRRSAIHGCKSYTSGRGT